MPQKGATRSKTMQNVERDPDTFIITDPAQMHATAMSEHRQYKAMWERYFRSKVLPEQRYGLVTRMLFTCPDTPKTAVVLRHAFPALANATLSKFEPGFTIEPASFHELGNIDLQFCAGFDTPHHGRLFVVAISCLPPPLDPRHCSLKMGRLLNEHTLAMTNSGGHAYLFLVTLVVPFTGCQLCAAYGESKDTRTHMRKCGRCWRTRHFPVWYCSTECQRLDYKRHRSCDECGKIPE